MLIRVYCAACEVATVTFYFEPSPDDPKLIERLDEIGRACECRYPAENYVSTALRAVDFAHYLTGASDRLPEARDYPPGFYPPERTAA